MCGPSARDKLNQTSMFSHTKILSFRNIVTLPKYYDSIQGSSVISRRYLVIFLSQFYSRPIQIHSRLNSNITDTQRSKNPFSHTDEDRRKKTYVFYVPGNLQICLQKYPKGETSFSALGQICPWSVPLPTFFQVRAGRSVAANVE